MNRSVRCALLLVGVAIGGSLRGQPLRILFYNVENGYDTLPSPFYDDRAWTPSGRYRWDTERYDRKIAHLGRVIDTLACDLVALAEVETEQVVRDLIVRLATDYNYIHRTTGDRRGMDCALLYKGDRFYPDRTAQLPSGTAREWLYVEGRVAGTGLRLGIVVCHMPSKLNGTGVRRRAARRLVSTLDSLRARDPLRRLVVAGDWNATPRERAAAALWPAWLGDPWRQAARRGQGTYFYDGRWLLYDGIVADTALRVVAARVVVAPFLLTPAGSGGTPWRTYDRGRYAGGYSDHLPVETVLDTRSAEPPQCAAQRTNFH